MKVNKEYIKQIFNWFVIMVAVTLPFPDYSMPTKALLGMSFFWILLVATQGFQAFSRRKLIYFLAVSSLFWIELFGLLWSDNFFGGLMRLKLHFTLLSVPLIFFSIKSDEHILDDFWKYFAWSTTLASLLALVKATYLYRMHFGNYFLYDKLALLLNRHPTYFSLFVNLALVYFLREIIIRKKHILLNFLLSLYLLFFLYLLSNRISFIALSVVLLFWISRHYNPKRLIITTVALSMALYFLYQTPAFQKRFHPKIWDTTRIDQFHARLLHWKAVVRTVYEKNFMLGTGTGGDRKALYEHYKQYGLRQAYKEHFNAHNQFLEILLTAGWTGFLIFVFSQVYLFKFYLDRRALLPLVFLIMIFTYMLTESILERHNGIFVYIFFLSLMYKEEMENE